MPVTESNLGNLSSALAGLFMAKWSFVERALENAIVQALDLDLPQRLLICSALDGLQKHKVLVKMINLMLVKEDEIKHYRAQLKKLQNLREKRNTLAHEIFSASTDAVAIRIVSTEWEGSKFEIKEVVWTASDVFKMLQSMDKLIEELEKLEKKLKQANSRKRLARALQEAKTNPFLDKTNPFLDKSNPFLELP